MLLFIVPSLALLALLAYYHHRAAVILLSALLPTYLLRSSLFGLPTNFLELAIIIITLSGLAQSVVRSAWRAAWPQVSSALKVLTLLFIVSAIISTIISPHLLTSLGILKGWILIPILFAWLVYSSSAKTSAILHALLLSGLAVSVVGLSQIFTLARIQSIYDVPNSLALFLSPLLVVSLWQKRWFVATPLAVALLLTQSVSALIAVTLALSLGTIFYIKPPARRRVLVTIALFFILTSSFFSVTGRLAYLVQFPNSISVRLQLWSIAWDLIKEHPLLGTGLGTFEPAYQANLHERFARPDSGQPAPLAEFVFRDPHNWILSFWLNTGLLGLLSFTSIHIFVAWKIFCRQKLLITSYELLAPALALLALLIFGLTDTIYFKNDLAVLHWLLFALLWRRDL